MALRRFIAPAVLICVIFLINFLLPFGPTMILVLVVLIGLDIKRYRPFAKRLAFGLLILFVVFLVSFYTNSKIVGEFGNYGTWVPDHKITTAVEYFLGWSTSISAAYFGYSCNGAWGDNCSDGPYLLGIVVNTLVVAGGYYAEPIVFSKTRLGSVRKK